VRRSRSSGHGNRSRRTGRVGGGAGFGRGRRSIPLAQDKISGNSTADQEDYHAATAQEERHDGDRGRSSAAEGALRCEVEGSAGNGHVPNRVVGADRPRHLDGPFAAEQGGVGCGAWETVPGKIEVESPALNFQAPDGQAVEIIRQPFLQRIQGVEALGGGALDILPVLLLGKTANVALKLNGHILANCAFGISGGGAQGLDLGFADYFHELELRRSVGLDGRQKLKNYFGVRIGPGFFRGMEGREDQREKQKQRKDLFPMNEVS
jgi:hypothetical protein